MSETEPKSGNYNTSTDQNDDPGALYDVQAKRWAVKISNSLTTGYADQNADSGPEIFSR